MDVLFNGLGLALLGGAVAACISIVRDALPHLVPEHHERLQHCFEDSA